jgi:MFS family permease
MQTLYSDIRSSPFRLSIWLAGVSFVLFQFFLQLSSGVVIDAIMHEQQLSAYMAGLLSSTFYFIYTLLQIPVGILFDRKNSRHLITVTLILCSLGCFVFARSSNLPELFLGRFMIGFGSAFAFVGLSHLLRQHYPMRQFAFMIGFSETLGFIATVVGMLILGALIASWGWRNFIFSSGFLGLCLAIFCWKTIPGQAPLPQINKDYAQDFLRIIKNKQNWLNGLFVGLCFVVVTAFAALWAVPFLQIKLHCSLQEASTVNAFFFLGTALSCPLFGWLSAHCKKRNPLILSSCLSTLFFLLLLLYYPFQSSSIATLLMFMVGLCCGAYMLAYSIANELAPAGHLSTCAGFTNMLAVITTPILQTLIGYLLDSHRQGGQYTLVDYQWALLTVPACLLLACALVWFLPEKKEA